MELIYTTSAGRNKQKIEQENFLVSLSTKNILAFTSCQNFVGKVSIDQHVYICDIDKPWEAHDLVSFPSRISILQWNQTSDLLLIATEHGKCFVFHMIDHTLNHWVELGNEDINSRIICAQWLDKPYKVNFSTQHISEAAPYKQKYPSSFKPFNPSFYTKFNDYIILVTITGIVLISVSNQNSSNSSNHALTTISTTPFHFFSSSLQKADIHQSNAKILVVISDGSIESVIKVYSLSWRGRDVGELDCLSEGSFFLLNKNDGVYNEDKEEVKGDGVVVVKFVREDTVVVASNQRGSSHMEFWALRPPHAELTQANNFFNKFNTSPSFNKTTNELVWQHQSTIMHTSHITSIATPRMPIISPSDSLHDPPSNTEPQQFNANHFLYVVASFADGSAKLINQKSFLPMATTHLNTDLISSDYHDVKNDDEDDEDAMANVFDDDLGKKSSSSSSSSPHLTCMHQSQTGCVVAGIDQLGQLYVMKAINTRDPVTQVPISLMKSLVEFQMLASLDHWDCMACLNTASAKNVSGMLVEEYERQPKEVKMVVSRGISRLKSFLATMTDELLHSKCRSLVMAIKQHFKTQLTNMISAPNHDSAVLEKISQFCRSKDCAYEVESFVASITSDKRITSEGDRKVFLEKDQNIIRWACMFVMHLVCHQIPALLQLTSPMSSSPTMFKTPLLSTVLFSPPPPHIKDLLGYHVLKDVAMLQTLQEIILMIKVYTSLQADPLPPLDLRLPPLKQSLFNDQVTFLFRVVCKMNRLTLDERSAEEEGLFMKECITTASLNHHLISPTMPSNIFFNLPTTSILQQSFPLSFTFHKTPLFHKVISPITCWDSISHSLAGMHSKKKCCRCGLVTSSKQSSASSAWLLKFKGPCSCGGYWISQD